MDISEGAAALLIPEAEVVAVAETVDGPVITTKDGQSYIVVGSSENDDQAGVMFYRRPAVTYDGGFPVFVPRAPAPPPAEGSSGPAAPLDPSVDPETVPDSTVEAVLAWVGTDPARAAEAHDLEVAGKNRVTLVAQLEAIATAPPAAEGFSGTAA